MLPANQPIVSILDIDTVIATIFVIERDYPSIRVGQSALLSTDAFPGKTFSGEIARLSPLLKESSRQARVEIDVSNRDHLLVPGMFIRAEIEFASHTNATLIPVAAIARRNGQSGVFLADTNTLKARFMPVTLGIVSADVAEVLDPALEGQIVTLGQHLLEEGSVILIPEPVPAPSAAGAPEGARP
jgi:RND family efflux transporter MFP subunit